MTYISWAFTFTWMWMSKKWNYNHHSGCTGCSQVENLWVHISLLNVAVGWEVWRTGGKMKTVLCCINHLRQYFPCSLRTAGNVDWNNILELASFLHLKQHILRFLLEQIVLQSRLSRRFIHWMPRAQKFHVLGDVKGSEGFTRKQLGFIGRETISKAAYSNSSLSFKFKTVLCDICASFHGALSNPYYSYSHLSFL